MNHAAIHEFYALRSKYRFIQQAMQFQQPSLKDMNAAELLTSIESTIPSDLISPNQYSLIKSLASAFTTRITSFFGFETRLNSPSNSVDYLFAVSSKRGEREELAQLFLNGSLPQEIRRKAEWEHIGKFVTEWANPQSILNKKIPGVWFEFDTTDEQSVTQVPSIFIQTPNLRIDTLEDTDQCLWVTQTTLPLLTGQPTSAKLEEVFLDTIRKLPEGASVLHVASMLSRASTGLRMIIYKIAPDQILPFLVSLGWIDHKDDVACLLGELQRVSSRIVLHLNITEKGVDQNIGFECAFSKERYNQETNWPEFFDYLISHGACLTEKRDAILRFFGLDEEQSEQAFTLEDYTAAPRLTASDYTPALVRYLSHIKVNYTPSKPIEAKAYPGVRLLGAPKTEVDVAVQ